jgi:hypothetical protein
VNFAGETAREGVFLAQPTPFVDGFRPKKPAIASSR